MIQIFWLLFSSVLFLGAPASAGGSRVGNGDESYKAKGIDIEIPFPRGYRPDGPVADETHLQGPPSSNIEIGPGGIPRPLQASKVDLKPLETDFEQIKGLRGKALSRWFEDKGWKEKPLSQACLKSYSAESENLSTTVVTSDSGKGVVIVGDKNASAHRATSEMLEKMISREKGCQWK